MALTIGSKLGAYEILAPLGAGGSIPRLLQERPLPRFRSRLQIFRRNRIIRFQSRDALHPGHVQQYSGKCGSKTPNGSGAFFDAIWDAHSFPSPPRLPDRLMQRAKRHYHWLNQYVQLAQ